MVNDQVRFGFLLGISHRLQLLLSCFSCCCCDVPLSLSSSRSALLGLPAAVYKEGRKLLCSARRRWRTNLGNHRRTCRAPSCVSSCCCLPSACYHHPPPVPHAGPPSLDESHPLIIHFILSFVHVFHQLLVPCFSSTRHGVSSALSCYPPA